MVGSSSLAAHGWRCSASRFVVIWLLLLTDTSLAQSNNVTSVGIVPGTVNVTNPDGPLPYGQGFAPDVVSSDTSYDDTFPAYEGTAPPVLDDGSGYDNGTTVDPLADNSTYNIDRRHAPGWDESKWPQRRDTKPFYLRVMPLGASITAGYLSSDNNGYRKWLREELRYQGWPVNMVGSLQIGTMRDRVRQQSIRGRHSFYSC
jgi:hypothetical protein